MYETYSAFKDYGHFYDFVTVLHIKVAHARFDVTKAENRYQAYTSKGVTSEGYSLLHSSYLLNDSINAKSALRSLEDIERDFFNNLSEDAKNEMDRICRQLDEYLQKEFDEALRKAV